MGNIFEVPHHMTETSVFLNKRSFRLIYFLSVRPGTNDLRTDSGPRPRGLATSALNLVATVLVACTVVR